MTRPAATDRRRQWGGRAGCQSARGKPPPLQPHLHRTATALVLDRTITDRYTGRQPATALLSVGFRRSATDDACQNPPANSHHSLMTTRPDHTTDDHSRAESRERYETILAIVAHNTGGRQPPLASKRAILTSAGHAGIDGMAARRTLEAAVANDDLFAYEGAYAVVDSPSLRAVIEATVEADTPTDKRLVATANRLLDDVRNRRES